MAEVPLASLKALARELGSLGIDYVFTGGSIVGLLLDDPDLNPMRPTDDVDMIVEVVSRRDYSRFEERMREKGFQNDVRRGAPMCRWIYDTLTVDIMPVAGSFIGLNTAWFDHALESALEQTVDGELLRVVSAPAFVATKLAAFNDRGKGDFYGSHDLEDIIAVVDGREVLVAEVASAAEPLREFVRSEISNLLSNSDFLDALPAHLPPDAGSQARLPLLLEKLRLLSSG